MIKKWILLFCLILCSFISLSQPNNLIINKVELEQIIEKAAKESAHKAIETLLKQQKNKTGLQNSANILESLPNNSNETKILRIGSGSVGGSYFVLGELVAGVVSHPLGSLPCGSGGSCGIANLQAQNITSAGSIDNLNALQNKTNQTGFIQSDIAYWAYTGNGVYANENKRGNLRAIASLYPEAIHIIVRKNTEIDDISKLAGKRVSLGAKNSGTLQGARMVLDAYNITEDKLQVQYLNSSDSINQLLKGNLDAVFFTGGTSSPIVTKLFNNSSNFTLLSIDNYQRQAIFRQGHHFSPFTIATNTYKDVPETKTISVYALWVTTAETDDELVYNLTKSLWGDAAKQLFSSSFVGQQISIENSLKGIGIPLHNGAKKYYDEIGKRF